MQVSIDQNACIGCGICADICSATFTMGDDAHAHVTDSNPDRDHFGCAQTASVDCPTNAIHLN